MALIQWPKEARITELALTAFRPGQINHTIPSTGAIRTFNRSKGRWGGTITLGQMDDREQGQLIEAFISSLNGSQNTTRIPLTRIKRIGTSATPIAFKNAVAGQYYNYQGRLILVGYGGQVFPELVIDSEAIVSPATFLIIRQAPDTNTLMRHTPHILGPWAIAFREAG